MLRIENNKNKKLSQVQTTRPQLAHWLNRRIKPLVYADQGGNYYYYKTDLASDGPMPFLDLSTHRSRSGSTSCFFAALLDSLVFLQLSSSILSLIKYDTILSLRLVGHSLTLFATYHEQARPYSKPTMGQPIQHEYDYPRILIQKAVAHPFDRSRLPMDKSNKSFGFIFFHRDVWFSSSALHYHLSKRDPLRMVPVWLSLR